MTGLRRFTYGDAAEIREKMYPDASIEEVRGMIEAWETEKYRGRYFGMFAITADGAVVGCVSVYEQTESEASIGAEVFPDERGKGYASEGVRLAVGIARERGYGTVRNQVRADNAASIALHEKLGFKTDGKVCKNSRGRDTLTYILSV
ncbi:MAG: GNAT family N-acetyltransferase [Clostridia bacterium]|nr:GNAT family N-acetyltransferase [Clostridia bacterium]